MCGIAGIFFSKNYGQHFLVDEAKMADSLTHRGPDEGVRFEHDYFAFFLTEDFPS